VFGSPGQFLGGGYGVGGFNGLSYYFADYWAPDGPHGGFLPTPNYSLSDFFNYGSASAFNPISTPLGQSWFLEYGEPPTDPDDD